MVKIVNGVAGTLGTYPGGPGGYGGAAIGTYYGTDPGNADPAYSVLVANGGAGGNGGAGANRFNTTGGIPGYGGAGGSATAYTKTAIGSSTTVSADARAIGGRAGSAGQDGNFNTPFPVGEGNIGGSGGGAIASAYAYNTQDTGPARAYARAIGGAGGNGYGAGKPGGPGGSAHIAGVHFGAYAKGTSADVKAVQVGGYGGSGTGVPRILGVRTGASGAYGGAGADSTLDNVVNGKAYGGTLRLTQYAIGGAGGYSASGTPGTAGNATSKLEPGNSAATYLGGSNTALGGAGGSAGDQGTGSGVVGGNADASLTLAGAHAVHAESTARGGVGGMVNTTIGHTSNGAAGGTATATATAASTTTGSDNVTATASALANRGGYAGTAGGGIGGAGGAALGASAKATANAATGGYARAYAIKTGGPGGGGQGAVAQPAKAATNYTPYTPYIPPIPATGGAGGAVDVGTQATAAAIGFSAFARADQTGGAGGSSYNGGGNGGAGANSTLTNAVSGSANGGVLTLLQFATGGAGGSSAGGTAGPAGTANSYLKASSNAAATQLTGINVATGGAGGSGGGGGVFGTSGAAGGGATAALVLTGAHGVFAQQSVATGGAGGAGSLTGIGGSGGTAVATAFATSTTAGSDNVFAAGAAIGGAGGSSTASGGQGGAALGAYANAIQTAANGGIATAQATETGGAGGNGVGQRAGDGGVVSGTHARAIGYSANVSVVQTGGAGGTGSSGASGGAGADSTLTDAVHGATFGGRLTLTQTAFGGAGGYGRASAGGGFAGLALSSLHFDDLNTNYAPASAVTGTAAAYGGAGGADNSATTRPGGTGTAWIDLTGANAVTANANSTGGASLGPTPGDGGNGSATATATATGPGQNGTAIAVANATGGGGQTKGNATAAATAITAAGQGAQASSSATGSLDQANTTAKTAGTGVVTGVTASTSTLPLATGGGVLAELSGVSIGGTAPSFEGTTISDYAFALGSPSGFALAANPVINNVLGKPTATLLGYGTQGGSYSLASTGGPEKLISTQTYTLDATGLSGYLIAGLADNDYFGTTWFTSLNFTATVFDPTTQKTTTVENQTFDNQNNQTPNYLYAARLFFLDNPVNLGGFAAVNNLVVSLSLTLETSSSGDGFGVSILLGTTGGSGPPMIAAPGSVIIGQSRAMAIAGVSLSETGAIAGETFKVWLSDNNGLLTAGNGNGATVTGSGTTNLTISGSLAQVNSVLGTLYDSDATTALDWITLNATDSLGGPLPGTPPGTSAGTIEVKVNGPPVISTLEFATINQNQVSEITGVSLSETGDTTGETFTATLSDTNGLLAATSFTNGATVTGSGTTGLVITGSLGQVNTALATLSETDPMPGLDPIVLHATDSLGGSAVVPGSIVVSVNETVHSLALGGGFDASVADLPGGGAIVVYDTASGVYARLYRAPVAAGQPPQPAGAAFLVGAGGVGPTVAVQSGGQFLVAYVGPGGSAIWGAIYSADGGGLVRPPFQITTVAAGATVSSPDLVAVPGGYLLTYEAEPAGSKAAISTYQVLNPAGEPLGSPTDYPDVALTQAGIAVPIDNTFTPVTYGGIGEIVQSGLDMVNGTPGSGGLGDTLAEVEAAATSLGNSTTPDAIVVSFMPLSGLSGSTASLSTKDTTGPRSVSTNASVASPTTVLLSPAGDGVTRVSPEITALSNGDFVAVWDQIAPADTTWTVAGQIVTPSGRFVGSGFAVSTALPASATPDRPAVNWLPNGAFVVTYDAAISSVASQKFDSSGNRLGGPFGIGATGQGSLATTVLGDGTLLTLTGNTDGTISGGTFSVAAPGAIWGGSISTDLGTAGNWQPIAVPDATETLTFSATTGGTLTGTVAGMNAVFSATGAWALQAATLTLAGEELSPTTFLALTDTGNLTASGGLIAASGIVDIDSASGAVMTALGGARLNDLGIELGFVGGQSGSLTVSGAGTAIQNTGTGGSSLIGGSGSGQVTITGGASVTNATGGILGVSTGGDGSLTVSGAGSQFNATGELDVGAAGSGHLRVENQATVQSGGNAAAPSQGFDIGVASGGAGDATVTGANSLLTNTGRFVVGDAGLGSLSIAAGGTVSTTPGAVPGLAGLTIANTAAASGSSVNVTGAGSQLQITGALIVGDTAATGSLGIAAGATVTAASLDAGALAGAAGIVTVSGVNSNLTTTGSFAAGDAGVGEVSILNGATVNIGGDLNIGQLAGGSGVVDVENTTGTVILGGNINIGLGGGAAEFIVGVGSHVQFDNGGETVGKLGRLIQHAAFDPLFLNNAGVVSVFSGTTPYLAYANNTGTVTQDAAGDQSVIQSPTIYGAGGTWQVNTGNSRLEVGADGVSGQTFAFTDNTGTLVLGIDQLATIDIPASGTGPFTKEANPNLGRLTIGGFGGTIAGFAVGDSIVVDTSAAAGFTLNGSVVSVVNTVGGATEGTLAFAGAAQALLAFGTPGALTVSCFAAGTRIATATGLVKVEDLAVGERVVTNGGDREPIVWLGQRAVNCARHSKPETVWPVRVATGAFGANVPVRDLYLSPDHAVFVNDVLVPVKLLINGTSIAQVHKDHVRYFHVELPRHAVILAEGLTVESYLDTGDRTDFHHGDATIRLFPDFTARLAPESASRWEMRGVAPLVMTGDKLTAVRRMLAGQVKPRVRVEVREKRHAAGS